MPNVAEQPVTIPMPDGQAEGWFYYPVEMQTVPAVLHLPDIFGVRESNRSMARRLAGEGYAVLVAEVFYREAGKPTVNVPELRKDHDRFMAWIGGRTAALTPEAQEHDASAFIDWLGTQAQFRAGPMAVVGHCWTGGMAVRSAAARSGTIAAAASFHGGNLRTDKPDSPHLCLPRIKAELYFGHGENDKSMPQEAIDRLEADLKAWGGRYTNKVYKAAHGWTVPDNPAYNGGEADAAHQALVALLKRTLS
jgi:carboxymethylenebutenolidase